MKIFFLFGRKVENKDDILTGFNWELELEVISLYLLFVSPFYCNLYHNVQNDYAGFEEGVKQANETITSFTEVITQKRSRVLFS